MSTPMDVALRIVRLLNGRLGQGCPHDLEPRHRAQDHRRREQAERYEHPYGARVDERGDDVLDTHSPQRQEGKEKPDDRGHGQGDAPRAGEQPGRARVLHGGRGSSEGSRRARRLGREVALHQARLDPHVGRGPRAPGPRSPLRTRTTCWATRGHAKSAARPSQRHPSRASEPGPPTGNAAPRRARAGRRAGPADRRGRGSRPGGNRRSPTPRPASRPQMPPSGPCRSSRHRATARTARRRRAAAATAPRRRPGRGSRCRPAALHLGQQRLHALGVCSDHAPGAPGTCWRRPAKPTAAPAGPCAPPRGPRTRSAAHR